MCLIQSLMPFRKFFIPFALRFKLKTSFCFWMICISFLCFPVALVSLFDMQGFHQKLIMFCSSCQQNQRGNSHQNCNYWTTHVLHQSQSPMGNWELIKDLMTCGSLFKFGSSTHWGRDKMATRHFQMHFLGEMHEFWLTFHWCLFLRSNQQYSSSDNGLAPFRQQAIIWTNDG